MHPAILPRPISIKVVGFVGGERGSPSTPTRRPVHPHLGAGRLTNSLLAVSLIVPTLAGYLCRPHVCSCVCRAVHAHSTSCVYCDFSHRHVLSAPAVRHHRFAPFLWRAFLWKQWYGSAAVLGWLPGYSAMMEYAWSRVWKGVLSRDRFSLSPSVATCFMLLESH